MSRITHLIKYLAAIFLLFPGSVLLGLEVLVFPTGERLSGRFIRETDGIIEFESDTKGQLRLPSFCVRVEKKESAALMEEPQKTATAPSPSSTVPTKSVDGPPAKTWTARVAFDLRSAQTASHRKNVFIDTKLTGKWSGDEFVSTAKYDFERSNHKTNTDNLDATAEWNHDLNKHLFTTLHQEYQLARFPSDIGIISLHALSTLGGVGYRFYRGKKGSIDLTLGGGYSTAIISKIWQHDEQWYPGARFKANISLWSEWRLEEDCLAFENSLFSSRNYVVRNTISLIHPITKSLSFSLRHDYERRSIEVEGAAKNELRMMIIYEH